MTGWPRSAWRFSGSATSASAWLLRAVFSPVPRILLGIGPSLLGAASCGAQRSRPAGSWSARALLVVPAGRAALADVAESCAGDWLADRPGGVASDRGTVSTELLFREAEAVKWRAGCADWRQFPARQRPSSTLSQSVGGAPPACLANTAGAAAAACRRLPAASRCSSAAQRDGADVPSAAPCKSSRCLLRACDDPMIARQSSHHISDDRSLGLQRRSRTVAALPPGLRQCACDRTARRTNAGSSSRRTEPDRA